MVVKRTWEHCLDKDIERIYEEVWGYVSLNFDLDDCPYLYLNKANSIHNLGLFTFDRLHDCTYITLNKLFLQHKDKVLNVIIHEFAHYVAYKKYGVNCHHNWRWQRIADQIGRHFGEEITTYCASDHEVLKEARDKKVIRKQIKSYTVTCTKCGHEFHYKKRVSWFRGKDVVNDERCTCPYCKNHMFKIMED